jgi:hypothetical protein
LAALSQVKKRAVLVLNPNVASRLVDAAAAGEEAQADLALKEKEEEKQEAKEEAASENKRKALIATGTVVAGFGALLGARKLAKK